MHFSLSQPQASDESRYDLVDALADADFAVVDADSRPAVKGVVQSGRIGQTVFVGEAAPAGAASHLQRPIDPRRILRTLDELISGRRTARNAAADSKNVRGLALEMPTLDDVVVLPQAPIEAAATVPPSASSAPSSYGAAKAAARAKARRARLASDREALPPGEPMRDVLVLDADTVSSTLLCDLLERFGFQAHAVTTLAQAEAQLAVQPFAAVFLDMALDRGGVALLQQIRALPVPWPHAGPAVLLVASRLDASDKVHAALAGLAEPLVKPLGRGDVARALESSGVPLPADARKH